MQQKYKIHPLSDMITLNAFGDEMKVGVPLILTLFAMAGSISKLKCCSNPDKTINSVSRAKGSPKHCHVPMQYYELRIMFVAFSSKFVCTYLRQMA